MPRRRLHIRRPGLAALAAGVILALVLAGALIWFRPFLNREQLPVADVPTPPALNGIAKFAVAPSGHACMYSIAITPNSELAQIQTQLPPAKVYSGPPLELVLSGAGYEARSRVPGGYPGGAVTFAVNQPKNAVIGSACFLNRGSSTVWLEGSTEPRTVARSGTVIDGESVVGDITLTFYEDHPRSLLSRLGEVFGHASNLTDRLVPVWLIWIIAVLAAFGVPIATAAALYRAVREDEAAAAG